MFQTYGANPTPMAFSEVFTALKTGTMDGQENPYAQITSAKFQEVQKYLSITGHVYTPAYVTVHTSTWNKLPADVRKILEKLSTINNKNLSPYELAEIVRPSVVGLLIQQIAPLNQALPIITFSGNLEQMILNIANQSGENGLILEPTLIQNIVNLLVFQKHRQ